MQQFASLLDAQFRSAWLTIGSFDGVHRGHQELLRRFLQGAQEAGAPAVVLTFFPHPIEILRGPLESYYLSSPEQKTARIAELGLDALIVQPFDEAFSQTSAHEFLGLLKEQLGFERLWVGHDFAMGHGREGNVEYLRAHQEEFGYQLEVLEAVRIEGEVVSSSRIRAMLEAGDVEQATHFLGRPFALDGEVVMGAKRGRQLGIPTANISVWPKRVAPKQGVYACRAWLGEQSWGAVTNIGLRPTFEEGLQAPVVEAHLLDYEGGEFYGQELRLEFLARLRDEQKFDGVEALKAQILQDIDAARILFDNE